MECSTWALGEGFSGSNHVDKFGIVWMTRKFARGVSNEDLGGG